MSEFELIAALRERIEAAGSGARSDPALVVPSGDDAAVSDRPGAAVTSVDALVEGVHFRIPPFGFEDVGHKALATALSDLAAMGALAHEAYLQLGVPEGLETNELLALADGAAGVAAAAGVTIAGGDVTPAPVLLLAVTAVGSVADPGAALLRSGARPGDVVAVTGSLGGAAAGLVLCERPALAESLDAELAGALRARQLRPTPRLEQGRLLAEAGATAMIDLSDGIAGDAEHVAVASRAELQIELERLPVQPGVHELAAAAGLDPLDLAIAGGEDYELLVTLPADRFEAARAALAATGTELALVGRVEPGAGALLSGAGAVRRARGFDGLRDRPEPHGPA